MIVTAQQVGISMGDLVRGNISRTVLESSYGLGNDLATQAIWRSISTETSWN